MDGVLPLVCQRCLGPLEHPVHIEVLLLLAATQDEVDAAPVEAEGPDSIVAGREMPVLSLVEDEVVLAIPIAPRHPACAGGGKERRRKSNAVREPARADGRVEALSHLI